MTAAIHAREMDGVQTVGLAAVAGTTRDQARRDDLAVEAFLGQHPVQDEAEAGPGVDRYPPAVVGVPFQGHQFGARGRVQVGEPCASIAHRGSGRAAGLARRI